MGIHSDENPKSTPVLNADVNYFALWTHRSPLVVCHDWLTLLDSRMLKPEPVSSGLKDKSSKITHGFDFGLLSTRIYVYKDKSPFIDDL